MPQSDEEKKTVSGEALYQKWQGRIDDALKREKEYRTISRKIVDLYEAKTPDQVPYSILYSNTEILGPAVYNSKPIPIVSRRFRDADPLGKEVSEVSTRILKFLIDDGTSEYDSFDDLMNPAVLEGLLVNRGLTRFKYFPAKNNSPEGVCGEAVRWDKFLHGYARTWKKVPWIAFEWDMSEQEIRSNFQGIPLDLSKYSESDQGDEGKDSNETAGVKIFRVYEIWDKNERKVHFISDVYPEGTLRTVADPLGVSGFYPVPKPLNFMRKVTTLVPTPLYQHYMSQAQELNDITRRLKAIIRAIRYRGAYNSTVEGIEKMLDAEDNVLVPVDNIASMPDNTTIDRLLYIVPVNELAQTAQSLYQQREQCKAVIFEITGISDILRGSSKASETAHAQEIKNQWGSLRLKKMQKEVQRYVRESLAIILEIAAGKFSQTTFQQMTGLPYFTQEERAKVIAAIEAAQQRSQAAAQMAQAQGQQPPPPEEVPPEIAKTLELPTWEEIVEVLQSDIGRLYKTDIETNSTIDAEAAQDKQDISDLMNALSQLFNALAPLVEGGFMPFDIAKDIMLIISRRYNFGPQLEDSLSKMGAPKPQGQEEAQAKQMEAQVKMAEGQQKMQQMQQQGQLDAQEHQHKMALLAAERETAMLNAKIARDEAQLRANAVHMKMQQQAAAHQQKMESIAAQARATAKKSEPAEGED